MAERMTAMVIALVLVTCLAVLEVISVDDIFFPYTPTVTDTDELDMLYPMPLVPTEEGEVRECQYDAFVTVHGNVHQLSTYGNTREEEDAGYREGVCKKLTYKIYMEDLEGYSICFIENILRYRSYNILKDEYTDHEVTMKERCYFDDEDHMRSNLIHYPSRFRFALRNEKEPDHFQFVCLVVYDCPDPRIPLRGVESDMWFYDGESIQLMMDGTDEHLRNMRNAGCRALGYYAFTMYRNNPMANTTSIAFNCPEGVDGFEKRVGGRYKRKWRDDWASDRCSPTITKTQLDKDGYLETISATSFQCSNMRVSWATPIRVTNIRSTVFDGALAFLRSFPSTAVGGVRKYPSFVRRYF